MVKYFFYLNNFISDFVHGLFPGLILLIDVKIVLLSQFYPALQFFIDWDIKLWPAGRVSSCVMCDVMLWLRDRSSRDEMINIRIYQTHGVINLKLRDLDCEDTCVGVWSWICSRAFVSNSLRFQWWDASAGQRHNVIITLNTNIHSQCCGWLLFHSRPSQRWGKCLLGESIGCVQSGVSFGQLRQSAELRHADNV